MYPGKASETIHLCEDDRSVRVLTSRTLRSHGYLVQAFANLLEALEVLGGQEAQLGLLITDMMMPEMGVRELASKALDLRPELRGLFLTGNAPEFGRRDRPEFESGALAEAL